MDSFLQENGAAIRAERPSVIYTGSVINFSVNQAANTTRYTSSRKAIFWSQVRQPLQLQTSKEASLRWVFVCSYCAAVSPAPRYTQQRVFFTQGLMTAKISACQRINQKISQDDLKLIRTSGHPSPPAFCITCNFCTMDNPHMWQQTFVTDAHRTVNWPHHDLLSRSSKFQVNYSFHITFKVSAKNQKSSLSPYCYGLRACLLHRLPARARRRAQAAWLRL